MVLHVCTGLFCLQLFEQEVQLSDECFLALWVVCLSEVQRDQPPLSGVTHCSANKKVLFACSYSILDYRK